MTPTDKAANFGLSFALALIEGLAAENPPTSKRRRKLMDAVDSVMIALLDYPKPDKQTCDQAVVIFEELQRMVQELPEV